MTPLTTEQLNRLEDAARAVQTLADDRAAADAVVVFDQLANVETVLALIEELKTLRAADAIVRQFQQALTRHIDTYRVGGNLADAKNIMSVDAQLQAAYRAVMEYRPTAARAECERQEGPVL